jgi:hypothetical protein
MSQDIRGAVREEGPGQLLRVFTQPLVSAAAGISAVWELGARAVVRPRMHTSPVRARRGRI